MNRHVQEALQAWREAERRLHDAEPGSPEEAEAEAEVRISQAEYESAVAEAAQEPVASS